MSDSKPIKAKDLQEYLSNRQGNRPPASYMSQHTATKTIDSQQKPAFQVRHISRIDFTHRIQSIRDNIDALRQHNQYVLKITSNCDANTSRKNATHQANQRKMDKCAYTLDIDDGLTNFVGFRKKKEVNLSFKHVSIHPYMHCYSHKKHKICKMISKLVRKEKSGQCSHKCSLLADSVDMSHTAAIKLDKVDVKVKHFFNIAKLSPWVEGE